MDQATKPQYGNSPITNRATKFRTENKRWVTSVTPEESTVSAPSSIPWFV